MNTITSNSPLLSYYTGPGFIFDYSIHSAGSVIPSVANGDGTIVVTTSDSVGYEKGSKRMTAKRVIIDWTADTGDGSVPVLSLNMSGWLIKAVTNPAGGPTDNYDILFTDAVDTTFDVLGGALSDRDTTNTEQAYLYAASSVLPIFVSGIYGVKIQNNAVTTASGKLVLYMVSSIGDD